MESTGLFTRQVGGQAKNIEGVGLRVTGKLTQTQAFKTKLGHAKVQFSYGIDCLRVDIWMTWYPSLARNWKDI